MGDDEKPKLEDAKETLVLKPLRSILDGDHQRIYVLLAVGNNPGSPGIVYVADKNVTMNQGTFWSVGGEAEIPEDKFVGYTLPADEFDYIKNIPRRMAVVSWLPVEEFPINESPQQE